MRNRKTYHLLFVLATFFFASFTQSQVVVDTTDRSDQQVAPPEDYEPDDEVGTDDTYQYSSDTLKQDYRSVVYDSVQSIVTDKGFYYKTYMDSLLRASQLKPKKEERRIDFRGRGFFNSFFGVLFWIVAIGLFAFIVYKLFLSNSSFLSRSRRNIESDISIEKEVTNEPETLLRNAIRNGNYRLAIRYLYLQTLSRLADKKFIEINANKTNYEYVTEVRRHKFANEFASLTLQYEYVWYGEYPVDERLFEQLQNGFTQFNKNFTRS